MEETLKYQPVRAKREVNAVVKGFYWVEMGGIGNWRFLY